MTRKHYLNLTLSSVHLGGNGYNNYCEFSIKPYLQSVLEYIYYTQLGYKWLLKTLKIVKKTPNLNNGLHLNPSKSEAITFFNPRSKPVQTLAESSWVHFCCGFTYQTSDVNQEYGCLSRFQTIFRQTVI